ncbi:MAG: PH domain-containing protein [Actinomycetota bacterium]|nr:PH domain-containing protein [Actinomycetota bacterium]
MAVVVWSIESGIRYGLGLVLIAFNSGGALRWWIPPAIAAMVAPSVVRYLRFRYEVTGDALVVQGGLLSQWRRVIPLARIQSVEVVQKLRHRLLDVVELRVEAAGGRSTEAALVALDPAEAERLRSILLRRAEAAPGDAREKPPLMHLHPRDLLLAGITGGRVAVIAALLGYGEQFVSDDRAAALFEGVRSLGASDLMVALWAGAVILSISVAISLVATVAVYWDFTVRREFDRLVVTRGLLERRRAIVPLRRVQAVELHENPVRRALGLAALSVVIAGQTGENRERQETSVLLPIARRAAALEVATMVLGAPESVAAAPLQPAPSSSLVRRLTIAAVGGLAAVAAGAVAGGILPSVGVAVGVLSGAWSFGGWRSLGHTVVGEHVLVRRGALVRKTTILKAANIQHLVLVTSPTQRPFGLATVQLRIPRASPSAVDLEFWRAETRFDELTAKVAGETAPG